jgi:hypothetical protein
VLVKKIWGVGGLLLFLVWASYALFVPALIRAAYEGQSLPLLNRMIAGQDVHPVEFYLARWDVSGGNVAAYLTVLLILTVPLVFVSPRFGTRPGSGEGSLSNSSLAAWTWTIVGLAVLLTLYLFYMQPVAFVLFVHEDYWAEWATSFCFSAAFLFLLFALVIDPTRRKWGYVLLALAAFFVAGEEFSWGQRILGVRSPGFLTEHNIQREMNLHNLAENPPSALIALAILIWAFGIDLAARRLPLVSRWVDRIGIPLPPRRLRSLFYAGAALLFLSHLPFLVAKITEIGELLFGCAVAALALHIALESAARATPDRAMTILSTGFLLAVVGISTLAYVSVAGTPNVSPYLHAYAIDRYPQRRLYAQAEEVFRYLERREALLADTTLIEGGRVLQEGGEDDKATAMLERGLERAREAERARPLATEPTRTIMVAQLLMGRELEAADARRAALRKDSARLEVAVSPEEQAEIHWSLAVTLYRAGQLQASLVEFGQACELVTQGTRAQRRIDRWHKQYLADAAPNGCAEYRTAGSNSDRGTTP